MENRYPTGGPLAGERAAPAGRTHPEPEAPAPPVADAQVPAQALAEYHAATGRQARDAVAALVVAGYHVGPIPYGYQTAAVPIGGQRRLRRLVPDPATAHVVPVLFAWRAVEQLGYTTITRLLAAQPERYPQPAPPAAGTPRPWTVPAVRRILTNPVYTGRQVWGRSAGGRPAPPSLWVLSPAGAHQALVDDDTFYQAQRLAPDSLTMASLVLAASWRHESAPPAVAGEAA